MKSVHKYTLPVTDAQTVLFMLRGAQVVHVDSQGMSGSSVYPDYATHAFVQIWALVDPSLAPDDTESRVFSVYGTGAQREQRVRRARQAQQDRREIQEQG